MHQGRGMPFQIYRGGLLVALSTTAGGNTTPHTSAYYRCSVSAGKIRRCDRETDCMQASHVLILQRARACLHLDHRGFFVEALQLRQKYRSCRRRSSKKITLLLLVKHAAMNVPSQTIIARLQEDGCVHRN